MDQCKLESPVSAGFWASAVTSSNPKMWPGCTRWSIFTIWSERFICPGTVWFLRRTSITRWRWPRPLTVRLHTDTGSVPLMLIALLLSSLSHMSGVQIYEHTSVNHVVVKKGHVTAVETDRGSIECEYFVNCAGQVSLKVQDSTLASVI